MRERQALGVQTPQTRSRTWTAVRCVFAGAAVAPRRATHMRDLTKKKLGQLSRALEAAQAAYRAEIEKLAEQARTEILPYFKRHHFDLTAGNGTWFISKPAADDADYYRPELHVEDDDLPKNIRDVLYLEGEHGQP